MEEARTKNAHSRGELSILQLLPLETKIRMSQQRIRDWYEAWEGQVYVSFSGGKDSTVLKHLVETTEWVDKVPAVFVDTGLEYQEVRQFAISHADEVLRPEIRFDEVVKSFGYPVISKSVAKAVREARRNIPLGRETVRTKQLLGTCETGRRDGKKSKFDKEKWGFLLDSPFRVSEVCCIKMKKRPFSKYEKDTRRKPFIATMASESQQRRSIWYKYGCNAFDAKEPSSKPISFWTDQDVLQYIREYELEYASVYGDIVEELSDGNFQGQITMNCYTCRLKTTGAERTGCMFCMFGVHLEKNQNRFQKMKETHQKQYDYCIGGGEFDDAGMWIPNQKGLGLWRVLEYIGVDYE